jgi:hypothetical protein
MGWIYSLELNCSRDLAYSRPFDSRSGRMWPRLDFLGDSPTWNHLENPSPGRQLDSQVVETRHRKIRSEGLRDRPASALGFAVV